MCAAQELRVGADMIRAANANEDDEEEDDEEEEGEEILRGKPTR